METFLVLIQKILPLYIFIAAGFILRKIFILDNSTIAKILIFFIVPLIVFNASFTSANAGKLTILTIVFFIIAVLLGISSYLLGRRIFSDTTVNLLAFTAGTANMGYFGLPVIAALISEEAINIAIFCVLGTTLYETTVGYFLAARGNYTWKESIKKLLQLPSIYAFFLGFVFSNFTGPGELYNYMFQQFKGCYIILGMMLIGIGLGAVQDFRFDLKFISASFLIKFILWPALILFAIKADDFTFHLFNEIERKAMIVLSVAPLAANAVAYATELNIQPGKAAYAVFVSTLFALFWIPFILVFFL